MTLAASIDDFNAHSHPSNIGIEMGKNEKELFKSNIHDRVNRQRLAKMVMKLFDLWELQTADKVTLLGLSPESRVNISCYRGGAPLDDNVDLLERVGHLFSIHKSLRIIYPQNRDLVYRWIKSPNTMFGGNMPLEIMKTGYEGLLAVRHYLEFELER